MAEQTVQIAPASTGQKIRVIELTVNSQLVEHQVIMVSDPSGNLIPFPLALGSGGGLKVDGSGTPLPIRLQDGSGATLGTILAAAQGDALAQSAALEAITHGYVWNGASWDRVRGVADSADAAATSALGAILAASRGFVFNGTTWDRARGAGDNADGVATSSLGAALGAARNFGFNGTTWDRLRALGDGSDGVATASAGILAAIARGAFFNGSTWDRARSASAAALSGFTSLGAGLATDPGNWAASSTPAVSSAASASRTAGGAGVRHVCKAITFSFSASTALGGATTVTINLRDGATGAGSVLWAFQFTLPAATVAPITLIASGLNLVGSANTAMTLEGSAGVTNLLEAANLAGYDAS